MQLRHMCMAPALLICRDAAADAPTSKIYSSRVWHKSRGVAAKTLGVTKFDERAHDVANASSTAAVALFKEVHLG